MRPLCRTESSVRAENRLRCWSSRQASSLFTRLRLLMEAAVPGGRRERGRVVLRSRHSRLVPHWHSDSSSGGRRQREVVETRDETKVAAISNKAGQAVISHSDITGLTFSLLAIISSDPVTGGREGGLLIICNQLN